MEPVCSEQGQEDVYPGLRLTDEAVPVPILITAQIQEIVLFQTGLAVTVTL